MSLRLCNLSHSHVVEESLKCITIGKSWSRHGIAHMTHDEKADALVKFGTSARDGRRVSILKVAISPRWVLNIRWQKRKYNLQKKE